MNCSLIGRLIKENRERLGISQEDLCGDSCAVSTLSRLENGKHLPSRKQVEVFFSYLGMNPPLNIIPMTESDFQKFNIETEIINRIASRKYDYRELLDTYEKFETDFDKYEEQFFLFSEVILNYETGKKSKNEAEESLKKLIYALKLTVPAYNPENDNSSRYYTKIELSIINSICLIEYQAGYADMAIVRMEKLINYYLNRRWIDEMEKGKMLSVLFFNLSNWKGQKGMHKEAVELSKKGIEMCHKYGQLDVLSFLIFNVGFGTVKLGEKEQGKKILGTALSLMKILNKNDALFGIDYLKNELDICFSIEDL